MKCPVCKEAYFDADDGDGFCEDIYECDCGAVWTMKTGKTDVIFVPPKVKALCS